MSTPLALLITAVLLAVNALFVAAEFALLTSRRYRLEQLAADGRRGAASALAGVRELSLMLAAAQLGITMASLGLGIIGEPAIAHAIEPWLEATGLPAGVSYVIAFAIALSIVVFLHMVVGEMMPKSWSITHPETAALLLARPFRAFAWVFRPVLRLMNALANAVVRLCGVTPVEELKVAHTPSDLALLVEESAEQGTLDSEEGELLGRTLALHRLDARAVKVPRAAVVAVPAGAAAADIEQVARQSGRSRLPVIGEDLDDVLGVVHVKDLLLLDPFDRGSVTAASLARPAVFAAETEPADDLLLRMRGGADHLVLVVDEYGGITGLVTFEDLVEELIGEFEDETDPTRQVVAAGAIPGDRRLDEIERDMGLRLTAEHADTLAGWVLEHLHRLATPGDEVRADGVVVTVLQVEGARITRLAVRVDDGRDRAVDRDSVADATAAAKDVRPEGAGGPAAGDSVDRARGSSRR